MDEGNYFRRGCALDLKRITGFRVVETVADPFRQGLHLADANLDDHELAVRLDELDHDFVGADFVIHVGALAAIRDFFQSLAVAIRGAPVQPSHRDRRNNRPQFPQGRAPDRTKPFDHDDLGRSDTLHIFIVERSAVPDGEAFEQNLQGRAHRQGIGSVRNRQLLDIALGQGYAAHDLTEPERRLGQRCKWHRKAEASTDPVEIQRLNLQLKSLKNSPRQAQDQSFMQSAAAIAAGDVNDRIINRQLSSSCKLSRM